MNEQVAQIVNDVNISRVIAKWQEGDFGPVVLIQGKSFTFVSFGLLVGLGSLLGMIHIWFYLGSYQILPNTKQASQLAFSLAFGAPLSAYIITRLLDIRSWISGEKSFFEYLRTVSFGLWGGLIGGLSILTGFSMLTQTPQLALLDAFAVGIPLAQVMGRLGCLNYGCCHGMEVSENHRYGIRYDDLQTKVLRYNPKLRGKRLHPTQIYSAIANFLIYLILLSMWVMWDNRPTGSLAAVYMTLYGIKRFSIEFLRGEFPRVYFLGITLWQWFSLLFVFLGLGTLFYVMTTGEINTPANYAAGFISLKSASLILIFASTIIGLVYGTHGRKIGSW